jgi:hypothetical protein
MVSDAISLRPTSRPAVQPLVWAFVISLTLHTITYGIYEVGHLRGWWKRELWPAWLWKPKPLFTELKPTPNNPSLARHMNEIPLVFVEVDPARASADAPEKPKYYSSQNTKAANPDPKVDTDQPKLTGTQIHVPKTENTPRAPAMPLLPAPPKPSTSTQPDTAETKPRGGQKPGDLAMAKPVPNPPEVPKDGQSVETPSEPHKRARTLAEAKAQMIPGQMMKQDGGVLRHDISTTLDAIGTPFGEYDREIVEAIRQRWYTLLDERSFATERMGHVVVEFRLNYDGRITNEHVSECTVDDLLSLICERAILDPAPYKPWPTELRRMMQSDFRDVKFTFYYD